MSKNNWSLVYDEYLPEQEGLREALCTLGNGYFATRGAFPQEVADDVHYPGTYLAGGYNRLGTEVAGRVIVNEDLVNIPNWLCLTFRINDGEWFQLKAVNVSRFRQELDIKKGLLLRDYTFTDAHGRQTTIKERRFVHMRFSHLAAIELTITADNWSGSMQVRSALDGTVENLGIKRYRELNHRHLIPLEQHAEDDGYIFLKVQTSQSEIRIAQAARTRVMRGHVHVPVSCETVVEEGYVAQNFCIEVSKGETITVEKIITQYTSKDHSCSECGVEALETIKHAPEFDHLLHSHMHAWDYLWDQFKIEIDFNGHDDVRHPVMILRLHLFHLLQTASHHTVDLDVGVPARGWHGEAYRGHIFWDELFIFPTLNFRMPEITQSLLKYRYRRLKQARLHAKEAGYKGAMFPWQSGSDGREESQVVHLNPKSGRWHPDNSSIQRHVSAAIAYNTWRYYEATGNVDFLYTYGAELFLEITRFWASIAEYNKELGRYEIKGVMGPDEYHDAYPDSSEPGLDNNAYTNVMVAWIMCRALEILDILSRSKSEEICHILDITDAEIERWNDMSQRMFVPYHDEVIISQFQGYDKLKEFDWEGYRKRYGDIQRLDRILEAEDDSTNRYKLSKQADVLMLFYLFSVEE
ncbi:MAG: glycoside hydrolase family 65 protein, partial [Chlamydiia bacterium]|nr:glycoside hydrolase family 65 protein [Chlamydiia bacterium]